MLGLPSTARTRWHYSSSRPGRSEAGTQASEPYSFRERLDDLPVLVRSAVDELAARLAIPGPEVSDSFYEALAQHDWPGNVRELFNIVERLLVGTRGGALDASGLADVGFPVPGIGRSGDEPSAPTPLESDDPEDPGRIAEVLAATGGNVARAARRLGIARSTLRYRIHRYGLRDLIPDD